MPQNIPKIIHCVWLGGGDITKVKSLDGIKSWITSQKGDYQIWIWWDDSHQFSMHGTRNAVKDDAVRRLYENNVDTIGQKSAPGRDVRNLRLLDDLLKTSLSHSALGSFAEEFKTFFAQDRRHGNDRKLALSLFLIDRTAAAMKPLRDLAEEYPKVVKLCNVRSHEFLPGAPGSRMRWLNRDLFDAELAFRGIFPAAASDILRYEALYNFGGIYMDVDLELTEPLGALTVDDGLARCAYEDAKGDARKATGLPFQVATAATHRGQCLYAMNNIVATHPQSDFADALRKSIRLGYDTIRVSASGRGDLDSPDGMLMRRYWEKVINKSTIDLTGPNLVREVQFWLFRGMRAADIPAAGVKRLALALRAHNNLLEDATADNMDVSPQLNVEAFPRFAKLWRDDDPAHTGFFAWAFEHTFFPMTKVNWRTEAATRSDTKLAGAQKT